jgi:hypothetical protein
MMKITKNDLADFTLLEPCSIELMNFKNPENTICELLRQTYHLTDNDTIRTNLRVAITMAKKMGNKLSEYRKVLRRTENGTKIE